MIADILGMDAIIVLIIAVVVLFGSSQLPKLAKNIGSAGRELPRAPNQSIATSAREMTACRKSQFSLSNFRSGPGFQQYEPLRGNHRPRDRSRPRATFIDP
jgi:Sec-independent protein translocase protein TatA